MKTNPRQEVILDLKSDILVVNKKEQNLLNPSTPNSLNKDSIKIYYLISGKKTEMFNKNLDAARQFMIFQVGAENDNYANEYFIRIFANEHGIINKDGHEIATTYIEWNNNDIDTLVAQIRRSGPSIFCEKISYNSVVKWDITSTPKIEDKSFPGRFFQVKK